MHSDKTSKKEKKRSKIHQIAAILCLFFTGTICGCSGSDREQQTELIRMEEEQKPQKEKTEKKVEKTEDEPQTKEKATMYYVHVCGAVVSPGVYEVRADSRLYEAIAQAGGVTEAAADESLNQAEKVEDGSRIYVPTKEEYAGSIAMQHAEESGTADASSDGKNAMDDGKIDLNTATKEQLMTLSGIGEAKASAIMKYRESHGKFQKIEDLMQVEGIKDGVFQKVKDQIKV